VSLLNPFEIFNDLLENGRAMKCLEKLDHIYSILGVANRYFNHKSGPISDYVVPDYTTQPEKLFTKVQSLLIEQMGMSLLTNVGRRSEAYNLALPSWVPDFTNRTIPEPISSAMRMKTSPSCLPMPEISLTLTSLSCTAATFSTISDMLELNYGSFTSVTALAQKLLDVSRKLSESKTIKSPLETLWRTLICDYGEGFDEGVVYPAPQSYEHEFLDVVSSIMTAGFSAYPSELSRTTLNTLSDIGVELDKLEDDGGERWQAAFKDAGDKAVYLLSRPSNLTAKRNKLWHGHSPYPSMITRWGSLEHRQVFLTTGGHVGLGPRDAKQGDHVMLLGRASDIFILRPTSNSTKPEEFSLVGDCYLHGFMDPHDKQLDQELEAELESRSRRIEIVS
jgi:hypothetical protein